MRALHFGAGNIGRGLIGDLLHRSGFAVCFVDIRQAVVDRLNHTRAYQIQVLDEHQTIERVSPVTALHGPTQETAVLEAIVQADLITTSVGVQHLSGIAEMLAKGLLRRVRENPKKLDVMANENAIRASSLLKQEIARHLMPGEMAEVNACVGFPDTAIDRQAMSLHTSEGEIAAVEPFHEWVIEEASMVNRDLPRIKGAAYVPDLQPYLERKLYLVNLGHAAAAYVGSLTGEATIQSALSQPHVVKFVQETMKEAAQFLRLRHSLKPEDLDTYIATILKRFQNERLRDEVTRVGRAPIRKLGAEERLVKPLRALFIAGYPVTKLTMAVAAALLFDHPGDEEAVTLQRYIREQGIEQALIHYAGIEEKALREIIIGHYHRFRQADRQDLLDLICRERGN